MWGTVEIRCVMYITISGQFVMVGTDFGSTDDVYHACTLDHDVHHDSDQQP